MSKKLVKIKIFTLWKNGDSSVATLLMTWFLLQMYLVDFQLVRYASPALDLVYILYMCLDRTQRKEHLDSLLQYYVDELHTRLTQTCQKLAEREDEHRDQLNGM